MDAEECYRWGELFDRDRPRLVSEMERRAEAVNLSQERRDDTLVWHREGVEKCRWVFVDDPRDVQAVRRIYADEENVRSPSCFVVVRQNDPAETRGAVVFDIFRLSPQSYLWHFNRVYTPPVKP